MTRPRQTEILSNPNGAFFANGKGRVENVDDIRNCKICNTHEMSSHPVSIVAKGMRVNRDDCIVVGDDNIIIGKDCIAVGNDNIVVGLNAIARGKRNIVRGENARAIGDDNMVANTVPTAEELARRELFEANAAARGVARLATAKRAAAKRAETKRAIASRGGVTKKEPGPASRIAIKKEVLGDETGASAAACRSSKP